MGEATKPSSGPAKTAGRVLHRAFAYDVMAWLFVFGREGAFRNRLLDLVRPRTGEAVLDVGCGTGTLAIAAKQRVGPSGRAHGMDASPEMIARARKKAIKAGVDAVFRNGVVEALPYPDAHFDIVLSTLMWHHLPRKARQEGAREMRRVLRPGGRVLVVDFGAAPHGKKSLLGHVHRHGHVDLRSITDVLNATGLRVAESGAVGIRHLYFAVATAAADVAPVAAAGQSP